MEETTCISCGHSFTGKFCNNCGEKVYSAKDKSIKHLLEEMFHFVTHFEGKFFTTARAMFTSPGLLSKDYCEGKRIKYYKPVSLFFLLVVVYLLLPFPRGLNLPLDYVKKINDGFVEGTIKAKQEKKGITYEELKVKYEKKSEFVSKFLLIIIIPIGALFLKLLFFRRHTFFSITLFWHPKLIPFLFSPCL